MNPALAPAVRQGDHGTDIPDAARTHFLPVATRISPVLPFAERSGKGAESMQKMLGAKVEAQLRELLAAESAAQTDDQENGG